MIQMASGFDLANVTKIVLSAPYNYHPPSSTTGGVWTSQFHMNRIAALSVKLFGSDSRYYTPPSPMPTPTPAVSPSPQPSPSQAPAPSPSPSPTK